MLEIVAVIGSLFVVIFMISIWHYTWKASETLKLILVELQKGSSAGGAPGGSPKATPKAEKDASSRGDYKVALWGLGFIVFLIILIFVLG